MKKNVIGHMTTPKESALSRFRRLNILQRLVCLLLALVIWLAIVNIKKNSDDGSPSDSAQTEQTA